MRHVEAMELQHDMGLLYDRIETIDNDILNEYQKDIAKQEGTTK